MSGLTYMWNPKRTKLIETETRIVVTNRRLMFGRNGVTLVKEYAFPVRTFISSEDLMYSMVIIVNNSVLYI